MSQERNNFKAGLFVLAGLVLALTVVFTLADFSRWMEHRQKIKVSFQLSDGLQGLRDGATVSLGDQPIGSVTDIGDSTTPGPDGTPRVTGKVVQITIPKRYHVYRNAVIELQVPTIGSGTRLNIASVGNDQPYQSGDVIPGGVAPNALARQLVHEMGIRDLQREQLQQIIANVRDLSAKVKDDLPAITSRVRAMITKAEPVADETLSGLRNSASNIKDITARAREKTGPWFERIDSVTANAKDSLANVREIIKDKDPKIRETLDHVHQITQTVRDKTLTQVTEALTKADAAVSNLKKSTEDVRGLIAGQRPVLERAIANAQLTTDQLKLAAIEVRRSPWRLLYSPKDEELETDNLYDAARSFAQAAGTLDAAAQSLQAVVADKEHPEQVQLMLDHLTALFKKYQQAEDAFWKALKDRTPGK